MSRGRPGLALGGGAALGAAHAGVLQALDEAGVLFEVVAGTSAGAIVGGGYAAGLSGRRLAELVLEARFGDFGEWNPKGRWGLFDTGVLERNVERLVGPVRIEELGRSFGAVAFDLRTREPVLIETGPLATALRASSAVPGLFPPVTVGDRLLVDGGVAANLPVFAARRLGAERVLAVSVDGRETPRMAGRLAGLARSLTVHGLSDLETGEHFLLRPCTRGASRWSPRDVPLLVEAGRRAVEENWEALEAFLNADTEEGTPQSGLCL